MTGGRSALRASAHPIVLGLVIAVGAIQLVGHAVGSMQIRGVGLATAASPLPLVFSHFRGFETFTSRFTIEARDSAGNTQTIDVSPRYYARLGGPYNRRNTYGAVISFGPALTSPREKAIVDSVLRYGFCGTGPLAEGFTLPAPVREIKVHIESMTRGSTDKWILDVRCPT